MSKPRRPAAVTVSLKVLSSGKRDSAVAPAHGLTLTAVDYPPDAELAARAEQTRNVRSAEDL